MSTRCQIQIEGSKVLIYKHCDGYPEGVLPVLVPFTAAFFRERGYDESYYTARLLGAFLEGDKGCLGYGVDTEIHGDLSYFYAVKRDGSILVRKRSLDFSSAPKFRTVDTIPAPSR